MSILDMRDYIEDLHSTGISKEQAHSYAEAIQRALLEALRIKHDNQFKTQYDGDLFDNAAFVQHLRAHEVPKGEAEALAYIYQKAFRGALFPRRGDDIGFFDRYSNELAYLMANKEPFFKPAWRNMSEDEVESIFRRGDEEKAQAKRWVRRKVETYVKTREGHVRVSAVRGIRGTQAAVERQEEVVTQTQAVGGTGGVSWVEQTIEGAAPIKAREH